MEITIRTAAQLISSTIHFLFFSAHFVPRFLRGVLILTLPGWAYVEEETPQDSTQNSQPSKLIKETGDASSPVYREPRRIKMKNSGDFAAHRL